MLTFLGLWRKRLITNEKMVAYTEGKMEDYTQIAKSELQSDYKQSICDDLEGLLARIVEGSQDMDR